MPARPYRASGKANPGWFAGFFLGGTAVAVAIGAIEAWVSATFGWNLILIFPAAIGFGAGGVAVNRAQKNLVRAPMAAGLVALSAGLLGQMAVHVGKYVQVRHAITVDYETRRAADLRQAANDPEALKEIQARDADTEIDAELEAATGYRGFRGFLSLMAAKGFTISNHGSKGPTISGIGTWLYWLFNFFVAGGVAFSMAYAQANEPFCESCKRWYNKETVVAIGSGAKSAWQAAMHSLEAHDWPGFARALGERDAKMASELLMKRCSHCEENEPRMRFQVRFGLNTKKPQTSKKYESMVRADEARLLMDALKAPGNDGSAAS